MTLSRRKPFHWVGCAGLFASLFAVPAVAEPITYNFTGIVDQTANREPPPSSRVPFSVGQQIPIVITVESAYPDVDPSPEVGYYLVLFNGVPTNPVLSATFGGQDALSFVFTSVRIDAGNSIRFNSASPQIASGFDLVLSGAAAGAIPTDRFPARLDPGAFTTATFSRTVLFKPTDTGFSGRLLAAEAPAPVPAPPSLPVFVAGLVGLLSVRVWKSAPRLIRT